MTPKMIDTAGMLLNDDIEKGKCSAKNHYVLSQLTVRLSNGTNLLLKMQFLNEKCSFLQMVSTKV